MLFPCFWLLAADLSFHFLVFIMKTWIHCSKSMYSCLMLGLYCILLACSRMYISTWLLSVSLQVQAPCCQPTSEDMVPVLYMDEFNTVVISSLQLTRSCGCRPGSIQPPVEGWSLLCSPAACGSYLDFTQLQWTEKVDYIQVLSSLTLSI